MYRKFTFLTFLVTLVTVFAGAPYMAAVDIEKTTEITLNQKETFIQRVMSFVVQEGENGERFFIVDYKARNIKAFDKNGEFLKVWGKYGFGPGEFGKACLLEYRRPLLAVMDRGKRKFMIYSDRDNPDFTIKKEFYSSGMGYDLKLINENQILISGFKRDKNGKAYELYIYNFHNNTYDFLLPTEQKYGYTSYSQYEKKYNKELRGLTSHAHCDFFGDSAYFVWDGNLRIIKINIHTKERTVFGKTTENYIKPVHTRKMLENQINRSPKAYLESRKFSFANGLFVNDSFVAVLYANYSHKEPGWQYYIQFYTHKGHFICEKILPGAINNDHYPLKYFYYHHKTGILYFLSKTIDQELNDIYSIIKYRPGSAVSKHPAVPR